MRISLIAAVSDDGVIGIDNGLPWHMPADLKRFKKLTTNKPILMGRKTWESIGKPLPDRKNIVVSRSNSFQAEGAVVVPSIVEALAEAEESEEVMIIGGAELYRQLLPRADRLYLTYIHADIHGDVKFPELDPNEWKKKIIERHDADEKHASPYTFVRLDRIERTAKNGV